MIIHIQKKVYDSCFKRDVAVWTGCLFSQKWWALDLGTEPPQTKLYYLFIYLFLLSLIKVIANSVYANPAMSALLVQIFLLINDIDWKKKR